MSNCCLKPDYLLSINTCDGERLELFIMKAKVSEAYKGDVKFVKTSIVRKSILNELVSRGLDVEEAVVYNALLHGNQVYQYQMSLRHSGIYVMQEKSTAVLLTSVNEIDRLVNLIHELIEVMTYEVRLTIRDA
ncbi:hypothetical protein BD560DRAFT_443324 [Blakeslea trispora]|nr:hypothetical protein BD560DRAFT_443324 [Blakeslea trispora]